MADVSSSPANRRRSGFGLLAGALVAVLAVVAAFIYVAHKNTVERRLVVALPDSIPGDPALIAYALPRGEAGFKENCQQCHGATLKGDSRVGIPDLTDSDWLYGSGRVADIERIILYGIHNGQPKTWDLAAMPAFATAVPYKRYKIETLSPKEVDDVATFLIAYHDPNQDSVAVGRGSILYHSMTHGGCFDCHADDGKGDSAIGAPDLTDNIWLYGDGSRESIKQSIEHGRNGICPGWINRLSFAEIREIALFVQSKQVKQ